MESLSSNTSSALFMIRLIVLSIAGCAFEYNQSFPGIFSRFSAIWVSEGNLSKMSPKQCSGRCPASWPSAPSNKIPRQSGLMSQASTKRMV